MISRGIPQRPLVRGSAEVVLLFVLLTLVYVRSCQAPMKLSVFKPPTHILVTEFLFCSRIRTSHSSFRKAVGEQRANPSDTGLALWRGGRWKILRPIALLFRSHWPTTPIFAHVLTCVGPTIVTMGTFVLIRAA